MVKIKICGITSLEDLQLAVSAGVDAVGFVFHPPSPRYVRPEQVAEWLPYIPAFVSAVGVIVDLDDEEIDALLKACPLDYLQFHGRESLEICQIYGRKAIKVFRVRDRFSIAEIRDEYPGLSTIMLDSYKKGVPGGTGETFNWDLAGDAKKLGRIILSGGLTVGNIMEALEKVGPYAVDVSSGLEDQPGKKDPRLVREFCQKVRNFSGLTAKNDP